jgi:lipoyl(octanoyl) transferase
MEVRQLGLVEYREALDLQRRLREQVQDGAEEVLLLLEHPPVYTLGRRSQPSDLPMGEAWYRAQGIDIAQTDRGGKLTYHGPGQLVGYPIVRVRDVVGFVRTIEDAIIAALATEGIEARCRPTEGHDFTGVWVADRKIASIGIHVSRGVSMHGFAVNVDNDLQPFEWVVACGLPTVQMTSVTRETGRGDHMAAFRERMAEAFCEVALTA